MKVSNAKASDGRLCDTRHGLAIVCVVTSAALAPTPAAAAELNGYVTLRSDYVWRGITFSDGHFAAQLGADLTFDNGFYLGAWASSVDIEVGASANRDAEVDYYVGYIHELSDTWAIGANAVAYTFPGARGAFDYDYQEVAVNLNYADRAWLEYAYSPGIFHTGEETHNVSLFAEQLLPNEFVLSGGVGHYDVSALSGSGYTYWELGVSRSLSNRVELDLRYHDANRWVRFLSSPERTGKRVVVSARFSF